MELKRSGQSFGRGALCMVLTKTEQNVLRYVYLTCSHVAFGQPQNHAPGGSLWHPLIQTGVEIGMADDDGLDSTKHRILMEVATVTVNGNGNPGPAAMIYPDWTVVKVISDMGWLKKKVVTKVGPQTDERDGVVEDFISDGVDVPIFGRLPNILKIKGLNGKRFAEQGDSGAPIFMKLDNGARTAAGVGILVGVDPPPGPFAYAHPLIFVFDKDSLGLDPI